MGGIHEVLRGRLAAVPPEGLGGDIGAARLEHDLGIDSLALHQLVVHLERSLAIEIPDEDTGRFITVTDIQTVLDRLRPRLKGTSP